MTSHILHISILAFLSGGLIVTALIKNYHYVKFSLIIEKETVSSFTLALRVIGNRIIGFVWVFPFSINQNSINSESQMHKNLFNKTAKYFFYFWITLALYCLLHVLNMK